MTSFLSVKQVGMLRDELTRLLYPNDADQIAQLRAMCDAWDRHDQAAFLSAWGELKIGYGVRLSLQDIFFARLGQLPGQAPSDKGGTAEPTPSNQVCVEARNELEKLKNRIESAPSPPSPSLPAHAHG